MGFMGASSSLMSLPDGWFADVEQFATTMGNRKI